MSDKLKSNLLKYGITLLVCLAMGGFYAWDRDLLNLPLVDQYRILCDAFTVPGILCILSGALLWVANEGALDGIGYVLSYAIHALLPGSEHKGERYSDYKERKHGKQASGYGFLFVVGLALMAVALVFYALYYSVYS